MPWSDGMAPAAARAASRLLPVSCALVFALLAAQVVWGLPLASSLDPAVSHWFAAHRLPGLSFVLLLLTGMHSTLGIDTMLAVSCVVLVLARRRREALWLALTVQGAMLLNYALKEAFARPRPLPAEALVFPSSWSFPSGHALASTVFWGALLLLVPYGRARRWGWVAAALLVALVALSRVYLGAHYLLDVLAGMAEGGAWLGLAVLMRPRRDEAQGAAG